MTRKFKHALAALVAGATVAAAATLPEPSARFTRTEAASPAPAPWALHRASLLPAQETPASRALRAEIRMATLEIPPTRGPR